MNKEISYVNSSGSSALHASIIDEVFDPINKVQKVFTVDLQNRNLSDTLKYILECIDEKPIRFTYNSDYNNMRIVYENALVAFYMGSKAKADILDIHLTSDLESLDTFSEYFEHILAENKAKVDWIYTSGGSMTTSTLRLKNIEKISGCAYPWFNNNPVEYFEKYLDSSSNNLLLLGPPGTGKSTFIAYMIKHFKMNSLITFDKDILDSDELYTEFLSSEYNLLLIEDADYLLYDRSKNENNTLHKILNASDGIVDTTNKKIVFTANIQDKSRIDDALIRPGRCFDIAEFRNLTYDESLAVAEELSIDLPKDKEYTISEIYNGMSKKIQKIGF